MDVDLCSGGDSTRKKAELPGAADGTMDVVPLEMYDSARAKIAANLRWLFAKAYGIGKFTSTHQTKNMLSVSEVRSKQNQTIFNDFFKSLQRIFLIVIIRMLLLKLNAHVVRRFCCSSDENPFYSES